MPDFLYEYEHDGAKWCLKLWAEDIDDGRARLQKLPHALLLGEHKATIPAGCGWLVKAWCVVANFFK